jgi:hypothetical protein
LATGSRVEYETQALEARREQMTLRGAVRVVATVAEEREGVRSQARVTLSGLEGHIVPRAAERRKRWLRADEVTGFVAASQTDLAAGKWRVVDAAIGMPRFDLSNLGAVGKLGDALTLEGGAGRGKFSVARPKDGGWRGDIDFAFTRLGLRTSDLALDTSGSLRAKVAMDDALQRFRLDPLRLDLRQVTVETQRGRSQSWLRLSRAALAWNSRAKRGKLRVHAGEIEDLRPVLIHGREKRTLLEEIPDLGLSAPVTFTLEVAYAAPRTFDVRLEQAKSPLLGVRGRYKRVGSESRGAFLIENARVGIVVGSKSELDVEVAVPDGWLQSKQRWINQR